MFVKNYSILVLVLLAYSSVVHASQKDTFFVQDLSQCTDQKSLEKATIKCITSYLRTYYFVEGLNKKLLFQLVKVNLEAAEPDIESCHVIINNFILNVSFVYANQSRFPPLVMSGFLEGENSFSVKLEELFTKKDK